jgi:hypothetical protein
MNAEQNELNFFTNAVDRNRFFQWYGTVRIPFTRKARLVK